MTGVRRYKLSPDGHSSIEIGITEAEYNETQEKFSALFDQSGTPLLILKLNRSTHVHESGNHLRSTNGT